MTEFEILKNNAEALWPNTPFQQRLLDAARIYIQLEVDELDDPELPTMMDLAGAARMPLKVALHVWSELENIAGEALPLADQSEVLH